MSHNTFGHLFRVTTFGESHGPAIGGVIDGCPPGVSLDPTAGTTGTPIGLVIENVDQRSKDYSKIADR